MSKSQTILIHRPELVSEIVAGGDQFRASVRPRQSSTVPQQTMSTAERRRLQIEQKRALREEAYRQQEQSENERKARLKLEKIQREEKLFKQKTESLELGEEFVADVDRYLQLHDFNELRKQRKLYEDWEETVYKPITDNIRTQVEKLPIAELEKRHNRNYDEFLKTTNVKDGIFLDIIIENDYNPLTSRKYAVRYPRVKDDPIKRTLAVMEAEKKQADFASDLLDHPNQNETGYDDTNCSVREGRRQSRSSSMSSRSKSCSSGSLGGSFAGTMGTEERFDVKMWNKVEATPHGRYQKVLDAALRRKATTTATGEGGDSSSSDIQHKMLQSSVRFDHFDYEVGAEAINREFRRGKKVFPEWKPLPRKQIDY